MKEDDTVGLLISCDNTKNVKCPLKNNKYLFNKYGLVDIS